MAWFIEVSLPTATLSWSRLRIAGFDTEYEEHDRKRCASAATKLSQLFDGKLVFRMRHRDRRRAHFYPAPRAAKAT